MLRRTTKYNTFINYPGLTGHAQTILSNIAELSLLATGKKEYVFDLDQYNGTARIEFADGTIIEIYLQQKSETGGDYHPAYLALKNSQGKVIPSSLWPEEEIERCDCDLSLYLDHLETLCTPA